MALRLAERSGKCGHDLDFAVLGVPGLTMMNRYISGSNIHTATTTDGKEWGRESELAYTVQSGALRDLNVRWRMWASRPRYICGTLIKCSSIPAAR